MAVALWYDVAHNMVRQCVGFCRHVASSFSRGCQPWQTEEARLWLKMERNNKSIFRNFLRCNIQRSTFCAYVGLLYQFNRFNGYFTPYTLSSSQYFQFGITGYTVNIHAFLLSPFSVLHTTCYKQKNTECTVCIYAYSNITYSTNLRFWFNLTEIEKLGVFLLQNRTATPILSIFVDPVALVRVVWNDL